MGHHLGFIEARVSRRSNIATAECQERLREGLKCESPEVLSPRNEEDRKYGRKVPILGEKDHS